MVRSSPADNIEIVKDYDAVFDSLSGEARNKSFGVLKEGGILVAIFGIPAQSGLIYLAVLTANETGS